MSGPHDLFARYTFSNPERAAAELRAVLPPELVAKVDWSTLRRESGSVVNPELRERHSDLLFSARLHGGEPVLFYFLLEHQSSVDRWMAFRMLSYVVRHLERWLQEHPDSPALPIVIPVVMYHGPEGAWTATRRVEELFHLPSENPELWRERVPSFEHLMDDLTAEREEALRARAGPPMVPLTLLLLRSGRSEELAVLLEVWRPLLSEVLASQEGREDVLTVIHYLLKVAVEAAHEALRRVLNSIAAEQQSEDLMRTMGEALIEQGREQGREQGLREGLSKGLAEGRAKERAEAVLRILTAREVSVDEKARQLILSCSDLATLDRWFDRALKVTRFADLFENS
jgi:predicted transposase/invertase (TIGR01784 family)